MVGKTIDHYRITEKLGGGGMGVVYLAEDTRLERSVAIKFLPPAYFENEQAVKRFQREAKAAAALNHPHICMVLDVGESDGHPYLVMEHLEGETLKHKLAKGLLPLKEALKLAAQIADALQTAHGKRIIHRDIKPANIFVTERGDAKVLDFGLAKQLGKRAEGEEDLTTKLTRAGSTLGTLNYMSPEQVKGGALDPRTDIFSLGVVLYEMLTGVNPFRRDTSGETISSLLNDDPAPLGRYADEAPEALHHILRKMLAKDPKRRSQSMQDVRNDLEQLLEDSGRQQMALSQKSHYWLWPTLSATSVLALVLVSAVLWFSSGTSSDPSTSPTYEPLRLTSYSGFENTPTFSPDGSQIAFSWDGPEGDNADIYVKLVGLGEPIQLTDNPVPDFFPAWSPDGRHIAFLRTEPTGTSIWLIPALGGTERKLVAIVPFAISPGFFVGGSPNLSLDWTPDGNWLVATLLRTEPLALHLISAQTGEARQLTFPKKGLAADVFPAVSPDGRTLAFLRQREQSTWSKGDIYLLELSETLMPIGNPKRLTNRDLVGRGLTWTPDGKRIIHAAGPDRYNCRLWITDIERGESRRLLLPGDNLQNPVVSRLGNRLAYTEKAREVNMYSLGLSENQVEQTALTKIISSTRTEWGPIVSPDGTRLAFTSDRNGASEIYVSAVDGSNAVQLTSFGGGVDGVSHWSPDGRLIGFDSRHQGGRADIYVIDAESGVHRRMTSDDNGNYTPRFSKDGSWLYYTSAPGGTFESWKIPTEGGEAVRITEGGLPWESPDGRYLYFTRKVGAQTSLWRMPVAGGKEEKLLDQITSAYRYQPIQNGVFFETNGPANEHLLNYLDPASGEVTQFGEIPWFGSITADGKKMFFHRVDREGSDLMLLENFR